MPCPASWRAAFRVAGPAWSGDLLVTVRTGALAFPAAAGRAVQKPSVPDRTGYFLRLVEHRVDDGHGRTDDEFFDLLVWLEFVNENNAVVQEPHFPREPAVHVALPDVAGERTADVVPDAVHVEDVPAAVPYRVVRENGRRLVPQGARADGLQLDDGGADAAVGVAGQEQGLMVQGDLGVLPDVGDGRLYAEFPAGAGFEPGFPQVADDAFPLAVQFPGAPHPVLPFGVDGVAFGEDVLAGEAERFLRQRQAEHPGRDRTEAGVGVDEVADVQDAEVPVGGQRGVQEHLLFDGREQLAFLGA